MQKRVNHEQPSVLRTLLTLIGIISGLLTVAFFGFLLFAVVAAVSEPTTFAEGNVALISIHGIILPEQDGSAFAEQSVSSVDVVGWIKEAQADDTIKAVIFDIESPGGTPVASESIADAIRGLNKTSVALIREMGASGAYWVASATDRIFASRMSAVGSIGVLASYLEFAGTLERYNATYRSLTAGEFKDTGSPFKELTPAEERMFQLQLDKIHTYFIQAVAQNRGLPEDKVRKIANGWVYLGSEALEMGLIDEIGNEDDVLGYLEEELGEPVEVVEFAKPLGFLEEFAGLVRDASFSLGKGIGIGVTTPRVEDRVRFTT